MLDGVREVLKRLSEASAFVSSTNDSGVRRREIPGELSHGGMKRATTLERGGELACGSGEVFVLNGGVEDAERFGEGEAGADEDGEHAIEGAQVLVRRS